MAIGYLHLLDLGAVHLQLLDLGAVHLLDLVDVRIGNLWVLDLGDLRIRNFVLWTEIKL